jgi:GT2 family glycosyltransferase
LNPIPRRDRRPDNLDSDIGCVAIGRNEGERLDRCLRSLGCRAGTAEPPPSGPRPTCVYVDSGSSDGSVELARALGAHVVELDLATPFTAARARNAGFRALIEVAPATAYVQFVDGDCEVAPGWLASASRRLAERPELAVVCGRRRERFVARSVYNRLCDIEWDTPVGPARACGGDALVRRSAFEQVGGFDPGLIAGEEPELCVRLRAAGHGIERLDAEMTLHDAAMSRFSQWWTRTVRSGHAYAEGAALHGAPPERHFVREYRRAWFWAAALPALALGGAIPTLGASLGLLGGYPISAWRVYRHVRRRGRAPRDAAVAGVFTTIGKFPELQGILRYHATRLRGRRSGLIEYKGGGAVAARADRR